YDFPIVQAGTYWMHFHWGLQGQQLMTAPPLLRGPSAGDLEGQDVVGMLNDFNTRGHAAILANLQSRGSSKCPRGAMAARTPTGGMKMAMSAGDLNDVTYDTVLANRRPLSDPEIVRVLPGRTVRLRIINGASGTNFFVRTGRLRAQAIAIDGESIVPLTDTSFELAIAQRIDLRVTIPRGEAWYPVLAQGEGTDMLAGVVLATPGAAVPPLDPKAAKTAGAFTGDLERRLRAARPLAARSVGQRIRVSLGGDMAKYLWTLNGQ